jgi:hypothetical protein
MDRETFWNDEDRQLLESLRVDLSIVPQSATVSRMIHDLTAAATAFTLMVEEYEHQLGSHPEVKRQLKLRQLQDHASRNQIVIQKITESLRQRIKSGGA